MTFSDYSRNALRMAALMKIRTLFVFTHDSIGVGEDGPTHQPVEHTASLRLIPNLDVWRPCDTTESGMAWAQSIRRQDGPSVMIFTRQNLQLPKTNANAIVQRPKSSKCGRNCQVKYSKRWISNKTNGATNAAKIANKPPVAVAAMPSAKIYWPVAKPRPIVSV